MGRKLSRIQQKAMFAKLRFNKTKPTTPPAPLLEKKRVIQVRNQIIKKLDNIPKSKLNKLTIKQKQRLETAKKELKQATTKQKLQIWLAKHDIIFAEISGISAILGLGGIIAATTLFSPSVIPILATATVGASVGIGGIRVGHLESPIAEDIIRNRKQIRKELIRQGFSNKQSKQIIKARVITLERKADVGIKREIRKDNIREQKRIKRLLR